MNKLWLIISLITSSTSFVVGVNNKTFPDDFMFGVVTSAYQVEGGWNEDGKGETIWDYLVHHNPSFARNNDTGDVACDSYHKYAEDIALAADLGVKHYKISISWSRIYPNGLGNGVNLRGIFYYQNIIDLLESHGITPIVTLYHWDLPQHLQDIGGWTNPSIVKYFVKYARTAFQYFDTVKYWVTFDEPRQICQEGYGTGSLAPEISVSGIADYLCSYVIIKAHGAVYNLYQDEFSGLEGKVAIVLDVPWSEPYSDETEDIEAAERRNQFLVGLYAHPIVHGNWPETVINRVEERSTNENFSRSRLPQFTDDEIVSIKGSFDFIGFNFYDTLYVGDAEEADYGYSTFDCDMRVTLYTDIWANSINEDQVLPWGIRKALKWIKTTYNNPSILITQNSITTDGTLDDYDRMQAIYDYLDNVLDAIYEDNVAVFGYTLSLLDEFEWSLGFSAHDGLYFVDFEDDSRPRTAKQSVDYYRELITNLIIPNVPTVRTTTKEPGKSSTDNVITTESSEATTLSTKLPTTPELPTTTDSDSPTGTEPPTTTDLPTTTESSTTPGSSCSIRPMSLFILLIIVLF